jgi:deazaflavin-dependent oxidoreductase (nitroreductase family)
MQQSEPPGSGLVWRTFSRFISIPWVSAAAMRLATVIDRPLMRISRGRYRLSFVIPCLLLRCRGVRPGLVREIPLLYVAAGNDLLLVGSGGGTEREPAWCANLRAQAAVEVLRGGTVEHLRAEELAGQERSSAWQQAVAAYPGYQRYQARLSRTIPLFRLRPFQS